MRRYSCLTLGLILILVGGCGDAPPTSGVQVRFASRALLEQSDRVVLYFFERTQTCDEVRALMPRPPPEVGPFEAVLNDEARAEGAELRLDTIAVGTYLIFVDALNDRQESVGTGCAADQRIENGETRSIEVTIMSA